MTREIKFRAWDEETKQMKRCGIYPDGVPMAYAGGDYAVALYDRPLMQYTGLKDKNGKEIYEGDILKDTQEDRIVGDIQWGFNSFQLPNPYDITNYNPEDELEIIGNIYQNPELLKK